MSNPAMASRSAPAWPRRAAQPAGVRDLPPRLGAVHAGVARPAAACACGGGCPRCQAGPVAQAKLEAGTPADPLEHEADRVSEQVLAMPAPARQRVAAAPAITPDAAPLPGGEALPTALRAFMEPRFGQDFSAVRVHADAAAHLSAAELSARAYTLGRHIVFAAGQYQPHSAAGRRLLAHELTHVVQQQGGAAQVASAAPAGRVQRDAELDEAQTQACLAKAEAAIKELETTAAKPDYPLPDDLKAAIKLLRQKMTEGKIKCYAFEGIKHGQLKGDEIRIDGAHTDWIGASTLLHEGVHAVHQAKFPKAGKQYADNEGKGIRDDDPRLLDMLRWKAYTEYWAYRSKHDYYNPGRDAEKRFSDDEIHNMTMKEPGVRAPMNEVRQRDADFDPRKWKPKG